MSNQPKQAGQSYEPLLPEFLADPYRFYHEWRANDPIFWDERRQAWVLTRYADVAAILRDARFLTTPLATGDPHAAALENMLGRWLVLSNPPDHTRLRALVNKAFTPRIVDQLRPHMENIVNQRLDQAQKAGRLELIADLAFPLPITVIALMLGVPPEDHMRFQHWSQAIALALEPADLQPMETFVQANHATIEMSDYFQHLAAQKRRQPGEDLLSALVALEDQGDRLSSDELVAMSILLLFAGHETTVGLIGNGTLALLRHPDQLQTLRADPGLIRSGIEEFLRYDSSIQLTYRVPAEDVTWEGRVLRKGVEVDLLLGAANRDPAQFTDPDRLDIRRADNKHLAFGAGIHYCLGAPLARVEAQVAIGMLLQRFPRLELVREPPEWKGLVSFRALKALPLKFN